MENKMRTGYFGRATENGHRATHTRVHIVDGRRALCGYVPHETMIFCWCCEGITLEYVECKKCKERYLKIKKILGGK